MARTDNEERINQIEAELSNMVSASSVTTTRLGTIEEDVKGLVSTVNSFIKEVNASTKTDWSTVGIYIGILITAISGMLYHNTLTLEPLKIVNFYQEEKINKLEQNEQDKNNGKIDSTFWTN